MKSEWKVFIKGVPNRGNEVIKVLTDLGAKKVFYINSGSNANFLYYINHKGEIDYEYLDTESGQIIMDNYKEIKLREQLKDGDILINNDGTCYKVFLEYVSHDITSFYAYNISISVNGTISKASDGILVCDIKNYRLATPSEIERFYKLLHDSNKDWDVTNKQLVNWKWKPKEGDDYWTVIVGITIYKLKLTWIGSGTDKIRYELGNCFHTCNEADVMLKKVKLLFNKE